MREYIATVIGGNDDTLDVQYDCPGYAPVLVGVARPLVGEDFAALAESHAPHAVWDWEDRKARPKQALRLGQRYIHKPAPEPVAEGAFVLQAPVTVVGNLASNAVEF